MKTTEAAAIAAVLTALREYLRLHNDGDLWGDEDEQIHLAGSVIAACERLLTGLQNSNQGAEPLDRPDGPEDSPKGLKALSSVDMLQETSGRPEANLWRLLRACDALTGQVTSTAPDGPEGPLPA
jgi:hypothetical protein